MGAVPPLNHGLLGPLNESTLHIKRYVMMQTVSMLVGAVLPLIHGLL